MDRRELLDWLKSNFSNERLGNKRNPLDEALYIILSKQTQEAGLRRAYRAFKQRFPRWDIVADSTVPEVEQVIKDAGLGKQRATHLTSLARQLRDDFGRVTLAPIRRLSPKEAERYLRSLPGLGRKSTKCILMYSLGHTALPIDVHTLRVAKRVGLLQDPGATARNAGTQQALEAAIPSEYWYSFHVGSVVIGRAWCTPRAPRCGECPLAQWCDSAPHDVRDASSSAKPK